jgi:Zn-dependent peptidase ImmA (M78 family)/transcriptional regulator with XRE-family HTH domain
LNNDKVDKRTSQTQLAKNVRLSYNGLVGIDALAQKVVLVSHGGTMSIDQKTLGARLKESRELASLTQDVVAEALGLPRTAIVQIEGGNRSVSSLELVKLAKLYHRDFGDFFGAEMPGAAEDPFVVLHRLAPGLEDDPEVKRQVEHCLEICREGLSLEAVLSRPERSGPPAYQLPVPSSAGEAINQGVSVARQERQRLGLGDAPIADMADLLNAQGIWATGVVLPDQMSGFFINHPQTGTLIVVNFLHHKYRKRFSYAHEYAHALMDRDRAGTVSSRENSSELLEKRANAFAAAFLMPRGGVHQVLQTIQKDLPSRHEQSVFDVATEGRIDAQLRAEPGSQVLGYQDVVRIADWFKVSYQATVYRLRSLGFVSAQECDSLLTQESHANGFRSMTSLFDDDAEEKSKKPDRELLTQVVSLAIEAFRREEISRGRVLELAKTLEVSGTQLLQLAEAAKTE